MCQSCQACTEPDINIYYSNELRKHSACCHGCLSNLCCLHIGAASVAPLDSKIWRQEVSLELEDVSTGTSFCSSSTSDATTAASAFADDKGGVGTQDDGSFINCQDRPESVYHTGAAGTAAPACTDGTLHAGCSAVQDVEESHAVDDADMIHLYPDYLLNGTGLKLLELCMAMWARDPGARPSCQDISQQLAAL